MIFSYTHRLVLRKTVIREASSSDVRNSCRDTQPNITQAWGILRRGGGRTLGVSEVMGTIRKPIKSTYLGSLGFTETKQMTR